jgi:hypothetical protein
MCLDFTYAFGRISSRACSTIAQRPTHPNLTMRRYLKKRFEKPDPCREIERGFRAFQMASKQPAEDIVRMVRAIILQIASAFCCWQP